MSRLAETFARIRTEGRPGLVTFTTAGNHQYNVRAAMNYVTGSHAFKFGMQDLWGTRHYLYDTNQAQTWTLASGVPTTITEYARPLEDLEHLKDPLVCNHAEAGMIATPRLGDENDHVHNPASRGG